ncbi:4-galactosyl-N-acetylglucosaminide 3-alpha-L-fucosyltransferase 9-like [Astyanax mexicanus]|uniref:4-galactosyl-N-acetylglucosaminide 3-alpha-L-fucosyltransferase 9-like n=1 Tax=Astyanax mexicanus TaxID=7994 RepID=UPI0020CAD6C2|nr:4-galactosyl-N-acetylglucosaminide 3-alpha-L-fucosyltransferase 9-like [Astyanax mexicanus]
MIPKTTLGPFQNLLGILLLLLCFVGIFIVYYNPTVSWLTCTKVAAVPVHEVCTDACLNVLQTEDFERLNLTSALNCTSERNQLSPKEAAVVEENASSPNTIVLVWPWSFGFRFNSESCGPTYGITGCHLTDDRSAYGRAHAVMFHHRDIYRDVSSLLVMERPPLQRWVWMNMESPDFSASVPSMDNLFNLTSSYRRDSDIWVPYGQLVGISEEDEPFQIPTKDKLVCWIVSHWENRLWRVKYFTEFSQHIKVEGYGNHFGRHVDDNNYFSVISSCKFYLSFENSIHKDYITEKVFNPLKFGTVPVVLGPPRENYEEYLPADSFIHIHDFKTSKELAEHLKLVDQNQEMYERYFSWRKHFVPKT